MSESIVNLQTKIDAEKRQQEESAKNAQYVNTVYADSKEHQDQAKLVYEAQKQRYIDQVNNDTQNQINDIVTKSGFSSLAEVFGVANDTNIADDDPRKILANEVRSQVEALKKELQQKITQATIYFGSNTGNNGGCLLYTSPSPRD